MKRDYPTHLHVTTDGKVSHDLCQYHCLPFAFEKCNQPHTVECKACSTFFSLFSDLRTKLPVECKENLLDIQKQLEYYLAHQTRKVYTNAQITANLAQLDEDGALIIIDYKMKILPCRARETKQQFFGKRGWSLHTVLIYTKKPGNNHEYQIEAHDHWSGDTRQDAWFTASSLHAVFSEMTKKPKWIIILSDNGPHYHNTEMMALLSNWKTWYDITIKKWIFLEAGEAKTSIDSHHAQVSKISTKKHFKFLLV